MNKLILRIIIFTLGLFIMAFGVSLSVKANLGISPISCVPYVYSCKFPLTLGQITILFNAVLIMLQMILLRRNYRLILVQLPFVFVLGLFIDLTMYMISNLYIPNYVWQVALCLLSCIAIAFGVFLEVKAKLIYLPGEGLAMAISDIFKKEFGKAKIGVDVSMVVVGIVSSFMFLHQIRGIGEGTIIAAVMVGCIVKFFNNTLSSVIEDIKLV
uniref:Membrane protein YczE n=1 Tax=Methanococcus maripaludis (strain C6 / ATCC BAA-1332) TaxID=444158 RepID=A9A728_METM6